mmetsp:Transcript_37427/g.67786  ORF Transcript_37427/g.67786 Transcript_37427/m.67786 type:complete len:440 (+) Transcript_37427:442-1761(+)
MLGFPKGLLSMITGVQEELESKFQHIVDFIGSAKQSVDATLHKPLHLVGNEEELEKPKAVRLGTFNVHIGSSKFQQIVDLIREQEVDICGLQEVSEEVCRRLQDELGFYGAWAKAPWTGNGLISRYKITNARRVVIEDRSAVVCDVKIPSTGNMRIVSTHLCHLLEQRRLAQMSRLLSSVRGPFILMGDMNALNRIDYTNSEWTQIIKMREFWEYPETKLLNFITEEHGFIDSVTASAQLVVQQAAVHPEEVMVHLGAEEQDENCQHCTAVETGQLPFTYTSIMMIDQQQTSSELSCTCNKKQRNEVPTLGDERDLAKNEEAAGKEQTTTPEVPEMSVPGKAAEVLVGDLIEAGPYRWQNVEGTCRFHTRIDYIFSHQEMEWAFVNGSYSVINGFQASDHNLVTVMIEHNVLAADQNKKNGTAAHQNIMMQEEDGSSSM